jgi:biotin/methionine sulfoxide reductase
VVRVFNDRGECLAGAVLDDNVRPGVVQLATGAWYTPAQAGVPGSVCLHGNPNVLTRDAGTSSLAQGPTAHTCLVEVARYAGDPAAIAPFDPPVLLQG